MSDHTAVIEASSRVRPSDRQSRAPAGANQRDRQRIAGARLFAELGPTITLWRVRSAAGISNGNAAGSYQTVEELLADVLTEHLHALGNAVCAAHDDAARFAPEYLLERLIRAWFDAAAEARHAHRTFLSCTHALPEAPRRDIDLRLRIIIELMQAAIAAAVPALAEKSDAALILFPVIRAALSDPFQWLAPPDPGLRQADARRITGMLLAAAEAEAAGAWPRCGAVEGADRGFNPVTLDCRQTRVRLREVLDGAEAGGDITITRRGKPIARVIRVR
ncbi:MAG: type II toxin-antitoxin system prevent-host-death family antitoxin [Acetobacteraceae bacterium]